MLSLAIGEQLEHTRKRSLGKKLQNFSILFYHVVLPGNIASNLRLRTTRYLPKGRDSSEKKNTLRTPSLLYSSQTYSSKGQRWSGQYKALPLPPAEPEENPCSRPKTKDHPGTLRLQHSAWSRGMVISLWIEGSLVRILLCTCEKVSCHVHVILWCMSVLL